MTRRKFFQAVALAAACVACPSLLAREKKPELFIRFVMTDIRILSVNPADGTVNVEVQYAAIDPITNDRLPDWDEWKRTFEISTEKSNGKNSLTRAADSDSARGAPGLSLVNGLGAVPGERRWATPGNPDRADRAGSGVKGGAV